MKRFFRHLMIFGAFYLLSACETQPKKESKTTETSMESKQQLPGELLNEKEVHRFIDEQRLRIENYKDRLAGLSDEARAEIEQQFNSLQADLEKLEKRRELFEASAEEKKKELEEKIVAFKEDLEKEVKRFEERLKKEESK